MYRTNWNVQDCDQSLQTVEASCADLRAARTAYEIECGYGQSVNCEELQPAAAAEGSGETEAFGGRRFPLAMAYVPWQCWGRTYDPETALQRGTLFPELDKPFVGRRVGQ